jgi:hypothetical protein
MNDNRIVPRLRGNTSLPVWEGDISSKMVLHTKKKALSLKIIKNNSSKNHSDMTSSNK